VIYWSGVLPFLLVIASPTELMISILRNANLLLPYEFLAVSGVIDLVWEHSDW
jgi:hypothetical protein